MVQNATADATAGRGIKPKSKAALRREKMAIFNARVLEERERVGALRLPLTDLVNLLACGNFFTELAAMHWIMIHNQTDKEAVMEAMLAGLSHPAWKARRACADYMDHFGDARCVALLIRAMGDPKEAVRRLAMHSLFCQQCKVEPLRGDFVPPLIHVAKNDRGKRVRRIAVGALGNFLGDERALTALRDLAEDTRDAVVASRAQAALNRLNRNGVGCL